MNILTSPQSRGCRGSGVPWVHSTAPSWQGHLGHHLPLPAQVPSGSRHERASSGSSQDSGLFAWHPPVSPALGSKEEKVSTREGHPACPHPHTRENKGQIWHPHLYFPV